MFQLSALVYVVLVAMAIAVEYDPKIYVPNQSTSWKMGVQQLIAWNSSFIRDDGLYYNNLTRLNINLYQMGNSTQSGRDELIQIIIQNVPMSLGSIFYALPHRLPTDQDKQDIAQEDRRYYLKLYPSFFEWPRSCKNCLQSAPGSAPFVILPSDCKQEPCPPVIGNGGGLSGNGSGKSDYITAVKAVGIAVGVVALIVFVVSMFVYGRRGLKVVGTRKSRQSGLNYRYKPPIVDKRLRDSEVNDPMSPSPLRRFFSVETLRESEFDDDIAGQSVIGSGASVSVRDGQSIKRQSSLAHLGEQIIRDAELSAPNSPILRPTRSTNKVILDLPPSPPKLYARPSNNTLSGYQTASQLFQSNLNSDSDHDNDQTIVGNKSDTSPLVRVLNQSDALMLGDTFRNALRTDTSLSDSSCTLITDNSTGDDRVQRNNSDSDPTTSTSFERGARAFNETQERLLFSVGSSPVLGRLAALDREDQTQQ
ncbi:hypothetical protein MP228_006976 [Amoeboaphelidium protococcarum]|nr:hypothetical protein MP228_006976 [Amoeboaphelidium protococcarum]